MPKGNVDYSKGLIYKLCCKDPNIKEIYVGSTVNFRGRKGNHKAGCNNPTHRDFNTKKSKFIRDNGGWENWEMILVEYYSATDLRDLEQRERYWFDELNSKLNTYKPYISEEENKEIINCDCGSKSVKYNYKRHCKSKKHIKWFNNNS